MASADRPNGRNARSSAQTPQAWSAEALLAPRKPNASSSGAPRRDADDVPKPQANGSSQNGGALLFQFSSASDPNTDSVSSTEPSTASTPGLDGRATPHSQGLGLGSMIERMNDVHDRSSAPQAKRRKFDTPEADRPHVRGPGGSGVAGAYVKEKQDEGQQQATASAAQTVDLTAEGDDEVQVVENPQDKEVCYGMANGSLLCSAIPSPKPGAKSLYGDGWCPAVKIVLKRLSGDESSKRVMAYDCTRDIIGNLDAKSAEALVPLYNARFLRTDCQIPSRKKQADDEPGRKVSKAFPINIILYGPFKLSKAVGAHLQQNNMLLRHPNRVDKGVEYVNVHAMVTERPKPQPGARPSYLNVDHGTSAPARTVEEVRSDVMGVFDSMGKSDDLPEKDPPSTILTPLLKHQKQGLYFMTSKEESAIVNEQTKGSFWRIRLGMNGEKFFSNLVTGEVSRRVPTQCRGGLLADMMGLGKTLSVLSLICSSPDDAQGWAAQPPIQPYVPPQKPPQKQLASGASSANLALSQVLKNTKTTLLVCPLSTVANWEEQIKQHIAPGTLSHYVYHGSNRVKDVRKLAQFDLVITTYGSVSSELSARTKGKTGQYPLEEIGWFRIVLDEAHMIREVSTLQFKAIVRLQASRRWAVTGTPVQNRLEDLSALLQFLRVDPFHDRNKFNRFIVEPFKSCDPEVVPKLRLMVDSITLRRLKDKIDLPPRTDEVVQLEFSLEERQVYDLFEKNAQDRVRVLAREGVNKGLGGSTYIHILRSILRLRLLCAHGKDLLNDEDLGALQGMTADMAIDLDSDDEDSNKDKPALGDRRAYDMFELMLETNTDKCSRCDKKLGASDSDSIESEGQEDVLGYMTPCYHVICCACIKTVKEEAKSQSGQCPICSEQTKFEYVEIRRTRANAEHDGHISRKNKPTSTNGKRSFDKYEGPHTKTKALVDDLLKNKEQSAAHPDEPPFKSVVFSGWTSHLDLIQMALDNAGIVFSRLDGTMSRISRTNAMDKFRDDPSVHVILVSITAGGLGLNLTAGNSVYVMEPQFNPAAEAQAIDRVHRLGQKRPVRTVRYIMKKSFEEKMLEIQDKKKKLASLSLDQRDKAVDKGEAARQKLMDLKDLFK